MTVPKKRGRPAKPQVPQTHAIEAAVNDVGASLAALIKAYESAGNVTLTQHTRVFNHLSRSLAVVKEQCHKSVVLSTVTAGFSLDGPEVDFIGEAQPVPVQRMVPAAVTPADQLVGGVIYQPSSGAAPAPRAILTAGIPPSVPPVGRLSKHAQEPGAGEKLFQAPTPQLPPDVPDEPGVGFIEEKN